MEAITEKTHVLLVGIENVLMEHLQRLTRVISIGAEWSLAENASVFVRDNKFIIDETRIRNVTCLDVGSEIICFHYSDIEFDSYSILA